MKICVFCGSRDGTNTAFLKGAASLGAWIGNSSHELVYGGADVGLMGAVANAALQHGAKVTGIMPEVLKHYEVEHGGLSELIWVQNMHQRKAMMEEKSDLFVTLPGGIGTLEEFYEQFTWKQIGVHQKPVILFNIAGFYDPLIEFMRSVERAGFLRENDIQNLYIVDSIDELAETIARLI